MKQDNMNQENAHQDLKGQKVIGIKRSASRNKDRIYTTYFCLRPFTDYELDKSEVSGTAVDIFQTTEDFPIVIGDTVTFYYGKAIGDWQPVIGYILIEAAGK